MPAITSATWRVTFKVESLTDQSHYTQDFSIVYGRAPVDDFVKEVKRLGYVGVVVSLVIVLV